MKLETKICFFIIINIILYIALYSIPINSEILENLCFFKNVTGKECFNCGMTRAFLSIIHFKFAIAYQYNSRIIVVFPLTCVMYTYSWYKYIFFERGKRK